jgi:three-Cys-motif partner protein
MANFFDSPQGAAVLKHGVMRRYPAIFASMTGSRAPNHRVVIADCYAGPGTYTDGTPGSPSLIAATADALAKNRNVEGIYVEADHALYEKLEALLENTSHQFTPLHGPN